MTSTRRAGVLFALGTAIISGFAIFFNGNGVRAYKAAGGTIEAYTTAKNVVAALVLIALAVAVGKISSKPVMPTKIKQWAALAAIAVFGGAIPFLLFFKGLFSTESTQAAVLHKTLIIWVAVMAVLILKEKLTWVHGLAITGIIAAQVGIAGGFSGAIALVTDSGLLMIIAATMLWAVEVVIAKPMLTQLSPSTVSVARMGGGAIVLIGWSFIQGYAGAVVPHGPEQWRWVLISGLILSAYVAMWHLALARAQAIDVTAVLVVSVPITAALNGFFTGADLVSNFPWYALIIACVGAVAWRSLLAAREAKTDVLAPAGAS